MTRNRPYLHNGVAGQTFTHFITTCTRPNSHRVHKISEGIVERRDDLEGHIPALVDLEGPVGLLSDFNQS